MTDPFKNLVEAIDTLPRKMHMRAHTQFVHTLGSSQIPLKSSHGKGVKAEVFLGKGFSQGYFPVWKDKASL